jgi:diguanylate cyclase (GGDEF)-like protein
VKPSGTRLIRVVPEPASEGVITSRGRPQEERRRHVVWMPLVLRLLAIAWAGAIVVALLDEFGLSSHLPFLMAMGMTGLLVGASFVLTRDEQLVAEEARRRREEADEDGAKDLLTDLPTFNHFARRLADEFNRSRRVGRRVSVVVIDVNNLSAVNKEYGVRAGDEVLRHVAVAIENTKRFSDIVARLGDDEFGVLLMNTGEEGVTAFVDRLEDRLARDAAVADVGGRSISLWAGICSGSAVSDPAMVRAEAVLEQAMASLTAAKQDRERRRRMWLSA